MQTAARLELQVNQGGTLESGRAYLRAELGRMTQGRPAVQVAERCRWTLGALNGGYAREIGAEQAAVGPYRLLMEGLESFLALAVLAAEDDDERGNFAYDGGGRRYRSVMPACETYRDRHH